MVHRLKLSVAQLQVAIDRTEAVNEPNCTIEETNLGGVVSVSIQGQRDFLVSPSGNTFDV